MPYNELYYQQCVGFYGGHRDWIGVKKMAVDEHQLCMGCMSALDEQGRCKKCGYDSTQHANINFLQPESRLDNDRYIVGKFVSMDPEGVWYVGYDTENDVRVWIREYVPGSITRRDHLDFSVHPLAHSEAQFKALMSDFIELSQSIMKLSLSDNVFPIDDLVYGNNTVYAIYRYIKTISLESFIQRSGGKLSWRYTKKLLMPLYHTVVNLHKAGLIHRGISPKTVQLDQSGTVWLGEFMIAAARTNKSEISAELFPGYSAPEQYSLNSWQGTWTDVYALGALTYRMVAGEVPPCALDRIYGDDLLNDKMISREMTENIINTINQALAVEIEDRIKTAESFIAGILANEGSNTAVYTSHSIKNASYKSDNDSQTKKDMYMGNQSVHSSNEIDLVPPSDLNKGSKEKAFNSKMSTKQKSKKNHTKKRTHSAALLILSLLVATSLLAGIMYWISNKYLKDLITPTSQSSSESSSQLDLEELLGDEAVDESVIPKLVGKTKASITADGNLTYHFTFEFVEKYNSDFDKGVVYDQQPVEGTSIDGVNKITLYVSKGIEQVEVPDLVDLPIDEATAILTELEIQFTVIPVYNSEYEPGVIIATDPQAGTKIDINDGSVLLKIKKEVIDEEEQEQDTQEEESDDRRRKDTSSSRNSTKESNRIIKPKNY